MFLKIFRDRFWSKIFTLFPFLLRRWVHRFPIVRSEDVPWTPFKKDLDKCKIALVTTAGVHLKNQPPFDLLNPKGDYSYRVLPKLIRPEDYIISHSHYDHKDAERNLNIVLPLDRLAELEEEGIIGEVAENHYSFMGHIHDTDSLIKKSSKEIAEKLLEEGVDVVILTPA